MAIALKRVSGLPTLDCAEKAIDKYADDHLIDLRQRDRREISQRLANAITRDMLVRKWDSFGEKYA